MCTDQDARIGSSHHLARCRPLLEQELIFASEPNAHPTANTPASVVLERFATTPVHTLDSQGDEALQERGFGQLLTIRERMELRLCIRSNASSDELRGSHGCQVFNNSRREAILHSRKKCSILDLPMRTYSGPHLPPLTPTLLGPMRNAPHRAKIALQQTRHLQTPPMRSMHPQALRPLLRWRLFVVGTPTGYRMGNGAGGYVHAGSHLLQRNPGIMPSQDGRNLGPRKGTRPAEH